MKLVRPSIEHLNSYTAALSRGWSPDNIRGAAAAQEQLARIAVDAPGFIDACDDPQAQGDPITLPDGSVVKRLPGFTRWMWDDNDPQDPFCGSINLRWVRGTNDLPPHVLGHIGYAVVPWKQRRGHATQALKQLLPLAWGVGLTQVELTTDEDNTPSQRVIAAQGGLVVEKFTKSQAHGSLPSLRFRIVKP
jgi:predicted acetyltransferase